MRPRPGLSNFGTKRISENGLAPASTPSSAIVGVFLLSCLAIGFGLNWIAGQYISFFWIFGISIFVSLGVSAFVFSWMSKMEQKTIEKKNAANAGVAARFEEREIEARRARAAKGGKTYK